ncbi:hypothetical protein [Duganella fentianensis]|uniref:hypothetical protein n=1 Tax=Duganella fentianensis TaxID=2692177 RepID=UPI0032B12A96
MPPSIPLAPVGASQNRLEAIDILRGLAMQYERLCATGRPYYWLLRRLLFLMVLGLIHLLLIWNGDILTEYALAGLLVLPLLRARRSTLAWSALALLLLYLLLPALLPALLPLLSSELGLALQWPDSIWLVNHIRQARQAYGEGNWLQVLQFSWHELSAIVPLHVTIFPRTLALFVLGMLAWRSRLFTLAAPQRGKLLLAGVLVLSSSATGWDCLAGYRPRQLRFWGCLCMRDSWC